MNQIVKTLISAISRRDQVTNDLNLATKTSVVELVAADLVLVAGGGSATVDGGPRGGWITSASSLT